MFSCACFLNIYSEKAQLDYILINKKWQNSATDCEAYSSFSSVGSDHRIITSTIKLKLRANKTKNQQQQKYNWKLLLDNTETQNEYKLVTQNQFDILNREDDIQSADSIYKSIITAHEKATKSTVPTLPKRKKTCPWQKRNIEDNREIVKNAQSKYANNTTKLNKNSLNKALLKLKEAYDNNKKEFIETKIMEIRNAHIQRKSKLAWDTIHEISNNKKSAPKPSGKNPQERLTLWEDHFKKLLGQPALLPEDYSTDIETIVPQTLPIPTHEFNKVELTTVIKTINSGKASGLDLIPAEVWKSGALQDQLLKVCNKAFNIGECPVIWRKAAIIPVPKKGDLTNRQNYRGISLIPIALKIYNKMLLNRLKPHLESILRTNQNGFREGRSTVGHILALRRIIEEVKINNLPAIINFIDFRKAFDSISREKLFQILASYGIPATIIRAIKAAYIHTTAQVITEDGNSNCFKTEAGVLQGDTLAPYLFIIMIDYIMRTSTNESNHLGLTISERQSRRYPATKLTDTDFADDIALFSDSIEDAQSLLTLVVNAAKSVGLNINEDKTEYMTINIPNNTELQANGKTLNRVDNFKYLGSWVENTSKDLKIRKGQAWTAIRKLDNIWKSKLPRNLKINYFELQLKAFFSMVQKLGPSLRN